MATHRNARAIAREQIERELLDEARRQLAATGAAALSVRSIARELGMVSSAVYRYVRDRDELLTRLIVAAYDSLGEHVERAASSSVGQRAAARWIEAAHAVRAWALVHPHEYALLYGSPVPGYAAPADTVAPGTRASLALVGIVRDAVAARQLRRSRRPASSTPIPTGLATDLAALRAALDLDLDDAATIDVLAAWTQLFGLVSFELFNQTRGLVSDDAALFDAAVRQMARHIGLT